MPKPPARDLVVLALLVAAGARAEEPVWPPPSTPVTPTAPAAPGGWPPAEAAPAAPAPSAPPPSAPAEPSGWPPAAPAPAAPAPAAPPPAAPVTAANPWGGVPDASPWAAPAPTEAPAPVEPAYAPPQTADRETREVWDEQGRIVRRIVFLGGALASETAFAYDGDGRLVEERTTGAGGETVRRWTYDPDGNTATHTVATDGAMALAEAFSYEDGRVVARSVTTDAGTNVTRTTYGPTGEAVLVETRNDAGTLVARTVADRALPPPRETKLEVGVNAGVATVSDVRTTAVSAGFTIDRSPDPAVFDVDPIELSAYASYNRAEAKGELTNDQLKAGVGFDYNNLVGPVTAFLYTTVERNPVANLDVDLVVAPIGVKYDIVPTGLFTLDASFAPVWNFRSIALAAGDTCDARTLAEDGHCTFSKIRGSFRARAKIGGKVVKLSDTLEFLPTLNPDGDFFSAIGDEAIVRNTVTLDVKLTGNLTLSESVVFVRDPLLAAQADCTADPDNLLCDGMSLQTGTTLALTYAF